MSRDNNKKMTKAGITYNSLHYWLRREFGSANLCESKDCQGLSCHYVWALKKGKEYDKVRENFLQLCRKCHIEYDMTPEWRQKFIIEGRIKANLNKSGSKHSTETKEKIKLALKERFPNGRTVWNKGKPWDDTTRLKMSIARMGKEPWNKGMKTKTI